MENQNGSMAVESSASHYDPWTDLEEACLQAFRNSANTSAPGLVAVLRRAVHYARVDPSHRQIIVERKQFLLAILSVGGLDDPSENYGNTATWMAEFIRQRTTSDITRSVKSQLVAAETAIEAHRNGVPLVASESMQRVGRRAVEIAERTVHRTPADLRHHVAAFLEDKEACLTELAELGWRASRSDLVMLKQRLLERISIKPEEKEDLNAWREILFEEPPEEDDTARSEVAGFASDRADAPFSITAKDVLSSSKGDPSRDPLDLRADVKAFARLICLEEAEPPLSIGVFGGWGSGKSTFMLLLEQAVAQLAEGQKQKSQNQPMSPRATPQEPSFISNVVQIRFNAWHFADANLWASLTAEFFDQLRAGGFEGSGKAIHRRLVERVNDHVHTLSSEAATARQALADSEKALQKKQKELDTAVAQATSEKSKLIGQTLADAVTKSFNDHKADLAEMGRRTYFDRPDKDIEDFVKLAKEVQNITGQLKTLACFIAARGARLTVAVTSFCLLAAATIWLWPHDLTAGAFQLNALGVFGFLAGAGGLARTILPGVKLIGGIAKSTADFAKELDDATTEEIKKVAQADEAVQRAAAEAQARKIAAERAAKALSRYIDPKAGTSNPPRLLRYMLEDDPDTRSLEKEIGLISRVRRLFQAVDEIVAEEKRKPVDPKLDEEGRDPDVPDRIVIYIDDLDRCTPSQVYAVLQAVHLMLAFRLFVVVVGVDVGWVEHSLSKELAPSWEMSPGTRGLATRYLEKIFQLPFWLQHLSTDGPDGGSYGRFVRLMLENNAMVVAQPRASSIESPKQDETERKPVGEDNPTQQVSRPSPPDVDEGGAKVESTALDEALSTVQMTSAEIEFLADDAIGRLAGNEPRKVKRFINIYRIIRARLDPESRKAFLGEGVSAAEYPVVCVLIAIETGQAPEAVKQFYTSLSQTPIDDLGLKPDIIGAGFKAASGQRGGVKVSTEECLRLSALVRRFSFNPIS